MIKVVDGTLLLICTLLAALSLAGNDFLLLCTFDNAMSMDLVVVDLNLEEEERVVVSWESVDRKGTAGSCSQLNEGSLPAGW